MTWCHQTCVSELRNQGWECMHPAGTPVRIRWDCKGFKPWLALLHVWKVGSYESSKRFLCKFKIKMQIIRFDPWLHFTSLGMYTWSSSPVLWVVPMSAHVAGKGVRETCFTRLLWGWNEAVEWLTTGMWDAQQALAPFFLSSNLCTSGAEWWARQMIFGLEDLPPGLKFRSLPSLIFRFTLLRDTMSFSISWSSRNRSTWRKHSSPKAERHRLWIRVSV